LRRLSAVAFRRFFGEKLNVLAKLAEGREILIEEFSEAICKIIRELTGWLSC
jgi:hypothetical protein